MKNWTMFEFEVRGSGAEPAQRVVVVEQERTLTFRNAMTRRFTDGEQYVQAELFFDDTGKPLAAAA